MVKTVALFGGSFNPPHEGHFTMASYIHQTLSVDETWMLFSENPFKDPAGYPALEHRMNMARLLAKNFDAPLVLSDEEAIIAEEIGRHETYYILGGLQKRHPDTKFIWVMGADSFSKFHTWDERDDILNNYIVAVVDRPGFTQAALQSSTAVKFADQVIDITKTDNLQKATNGWCFLNNPHIDTSSTDIIKKITAGETITDKRYAEVLEYIYEHGLYNSAPSCQRNHVPQPAA